MTERDPMIHVRIPAALRDELQDIAQNNGRTMSAEVVLRLSRKGDSKSDECRDFLREEAAELEAQIPGIKWELDQAHKQLGEMIAALTETDTPITDDKIALLQSQTRFYRAKLEDAESRLRRIKRVLGE